MSRRQPPDRVLVTGSRGYLGTWTVGHLIDGGWQVTEFDAVLGDDLMDLDGLDKAVGGCVAVVHLAALPHDDAGTPQDVMRVNALGTWHVLQAAQRAGVRRVVVASSAMAMGYFQSGLVPDQLPLDDEHEARPRSGYSLSKRFGEQMCEAASASGAMATVCLRATMIVDPADRDRAAADLAAEVTMGGPRIDYGAWVDVRDVARAVRAALSAPPEGHLTCLVSDDELVAGRDPGELAARAYPGVPWRGGPGPLVRSDRARALLGWRPRWTWSGEARFDEGQAQGPC